MMAQSRARSRERMKRSACVRIQRKREDRRRAETACHDDNTSPHTTTAILGSSWQLAASRKEEGTITWSVARYLRIFYILCKKRECVCLSMRMRGCICAFGRRNLYLLFAFIFINVGVSKRVHVFERMSVRTEVSAPCHGETEGRKIIHTSCGIDYTKKLAPMPL